MLSDSDSNEDLESTALREALTRYAARPTMYGFPEALEELAKHVVHVLLSVLMPGWRFGDTQVFWRTIAMDLGYGDRCAGDEEAHRAQRWQMWGGREQESQTQVLTAFKRIWVEMSHLADNRA